MFVRRANFKVPISFRGSTVSNLKFFQNRCGEQGGGVQNEHA